MDLPPRLRPCGLTWLYLTAAGLLSTQPALAQCSSGIACGPSSPYGSDNRTDLPGQNVVVSATAVAIEIPVANFGAASHTSAAPAPRLPAPPADLQSMTGDSSPPAARLSAETAATLLRLQPAVLDQDGRQALSDIGSPTNLWNAESIVYKLERTGGPCSLNRQGPQINTCR